MLKNIMNEASDSFFAPTKPDTDKPDTDNFDGEK